MGYIRGFGIACWTLWDLTKQKERVKGLPDVSDVGDRVDGQNIIVTGPTSGIGKETAKELVRRGANVTLACRNLELGEALKREIDAESSMHKGSKMASPEVSELDLSSMESVRAFAGRWAATGRPLHVLVNNGGMNDMGAAPRRESADGLEVHLATNFAGPALLTLLMLPALLSAAEQTGRPARAVHVSSIGHFLGRVYRNDLGLSRNYDSQRAYAQSKLLQVLFAWELARRGRGRLLSVSLHPGAVNTNITRDLPEGRVRDTVIKGVEKYGLAPREGARASLVAATDASLDALAADDAEPVYLTYTGRRQRAARKARDPARAAWVWGWTARTLKVGDLGDVGARGARGHGDASGRVAGAAGLAGVDFDAPASSESSVSIISSHSWATNEAVKISPDPTP